MRTRLFVGLLPAAAVILLHAGAASAQSKAKARPRRPKKG